MPPCPHFDLKIVQRSKRQSAVAAAYHSGGRCVTGPASATLPRFYGGEQFLQALCFFAARTHGAWCSPLSPGAPGCGARAWWGWISARYSGMSLSVRKVWWLYSPV